MSGNDQMNHVDLLFPSKYLRAADLGEKDAVVEISAIDPRHQLRRADNTTEEKPVVSMKGTDKLWVLNKTNAKTIARLYGKRPREWIGKRVTLYPTEVAAFGKQHETIRVRETVPATTTTKKDKE